MNPREANLDAGGPFGDYQILREIGRSSRAVVCEARQVSLDRVVALKVLDAGQLGTEAADRRFRTAAGEAARLDHPGIVRIYEVGQHEGQHFIAMALVEGDSLSRRLEKGPLPAREAAQLVRQIAEAVHYAHTKGVFHRSLRPDNVLIDRRGTPRLIGFGLSGRILRENLEARCYAAPEQVNEPEETEELAEIYHLAPEPDVRPEEGLVQIDVYGLGALLYVLLTGRPPFEAVRDASEPVEPSRLNPRIARDLETICLKCLQKNPRRRYESAADVMGDLLRWLNNRPIKVRRAAGWRQLLLWSRRNPRMVAWALLVLLWVAGPEVVRGCGELVERRQAWSVLLRPDAEPEQYAEALRYYEGAHARNPRDRATQLGLGIARYRTGDYGRAETALKSKPKYYLNARTEAVGQLFAAMAAFHAGDLPDVLSTPERRSEVLPEPRTDTEASLQREAAALVNNVAALTQRLTDPRPRVQRAAVNALTLMGHAALPALRKRLALIGSNPAPDETVLRTQIQRALAKIEGRKGIKPIQ